MGQAQAKASDIGRWYYINDKLLQYQILWCTIFRVIYDEFQMKGPKDPDPITGIQLLGVVLANSLPPFVPGCGIQKEM